MSRIIAFSDCHAHIKEVKFPDGDILIFAGDIGNGRTTEAEFVEFAEVINKLPFSQKMITFGNHDVCVERNFDLSRMLDAHILHDSEVVIDGIKFFGSPYSPKFGSGWSYNIQRGYPAQQKWAQIPDDTNILVVHGPPHGILDVVDGFYKESVGCEELAKRVMALKQLRLNVYGHIHTNFGQLNHNGVLFANVALCDDRNKLIHEPMIIDI